MGSSPYVPWDILLSYIFQEHNQQGKKMSHAAKLIEKGKEMSLLRRSKSDTMVFCTQKMLLTLGKRLFSLRAGAESNIWVRLQVCSHKYVSNQQQVTSTSVCLWKQRLFVARETF